MIYLTGDVHSKSLNNWEQHISGTEIESAKKYLEILKKYEISCTLFINGQCLDIERESFKGLLNFNVEFGGHTYNNFGKLGSIKSYLYRKIFGCVYGSEKFQKKDIQKTRKAFEKLNLKMNSWRTHAFGSNERTFQILKQEGVNFVSDLVGDIKPFNKGISHVPINIPVDQNTIVYGKLKPENRDPFASCVKGRISADEWFEILKKRIIDNEKKKIDSVILIHPTTMAVLDNFKIFEQIAKFISKYKSAKISEIKINSF
jgi:hypothetical protein